jgi:biopolymer transport protein ExbD
MRLVLPSARSRRLRVTLTSLVDVIFILLFFFMLASQQMQWRALDIDLAAAVGGAPAPGAPTRTMHLTLPAEGDVSHEGETLSPTELRDRVARHAASGPVVITPLAGASVDRLVRLLDLLEPTGARLLLGGAAP